MKFTGVMFALLAVVGAAVAQSCSPGYTRSYSTYRAPTYVAPTYVAPTKAYVAPTYDYYEAPFVLKLKAVVPLLELPTYSVGVYTPPPAAPYGNVNPIPNPAMQQQAQGELSQVLNGLKEVTTTLRDFDSRLRRLEEKSGYAPQQQKLPAPKQQQQSKAPTGKQLSFAAVNQAFCAACHAKGNESNGGDFVMSDENGALVALTAEQVVAVQTQLLKGKMPLINERAKKHNITRKMTEEETLAILGEIDRQLASK